MSEKRRVQVPSPGYTSITVEPASIRANRINSDSLDWSYIGLSLRRNFSPSDGRETAIDRQIHPVHEARLIRSEKQRGRRDFLGKPHFSPRDQGFEHSLGLLGEDLVLHRCGDRAGAQHIHPDVPALQLVEPSACE